MPPPLMKQVAHSGLGIGAKIDMIYTLAHPHGPILNFMPNASAKDRIGGTVTRLDQQVIKKKMVNCVFFTNPSLPGVELFCSITAQFAMKEKAAIPWASFAPIAAVVPGVQALDGT